MSTSETRLRHTVVGVRFDDAEYEQALRLAANAGISVPELIRRALDREAKTQEASQ